MPPTVSGMRSLLQYPVRPLMRMAYQLAYCLLLIYWRVRRPETRGAYVAVWFRDELLMIRNSYKNCETFPAGGVARGESTRAAAIRELAEEVGIQAAEPDLVFAGSYVSESEHKRDTCDVFEFRCERRPDVHVDGVEVIRVAWRSVTEIVACPHSDIVRQYLSAQTA